MRFPPFSRPEKYKKTFVLCSPHDDGTIRTRHTALYTRRVCARNCTSTYRQSEVGDVCVVCVWYLRRQWHIFFEAVMESPVYEVSTRLCVLCVYDQDTFSMCVDPHYGPIHLSIKMNV